MNGNDIDARCYGYEPASTQLKQLRKEIAELRISLEWNKDLIREVKDARDYAEDKLDRLTDSL